MMPDICPLWVIPAQAANVTTVIGTTQAQYRETFSGWSHPRQGMEKTAAKNVAGRNNMVRTAIVFIDEPSRRAASARSLPA